MSSAKHDPNTCHICTAGLEHSPQWHDQQAGRIPAPREKSCAELCEEARRNELEACALISEYNGHTKTANAIRDRVI